MLIAPLTLAVILVVGIEKFPSPLMNSYPYHNQTPAEIMQGDRLVRDRLSMAVLMELFTLTVLIRPWDFPWRARRWFVATMVLFPWSAILFASAMHGGRLLALHAMVLTGFCFFVMPLVTFVLAARTLAARPGVPRAQKPIAVSLP